jgi:hypothetical protein
MSHESDMWRRKLATRDVALSCLDRGLHQGLTRGLKALRPFKLFKPSLSRFGAIALFEVRHA